MSKEHFQSYRFKVGPGDQGKRLDQVLAANIPDLSRRKARVLLELGGVFVDGARTKVSGRLMRAGQAIVANVGGSLHRASGELGQAARARDEAALPAYRIVHRDEDLVIVDKPSGLLTAPTPEGDRGNLAHALGRVFGEIFLVHRIDLETSGLLVFALNAATNRALAEVFREHHIEREYLALLQGSASFDEQRVDHPVGGKRAVTHFTVLERLGSDATLVRCTLETGRTHQIRLHAQHLRLPVLGDKRHGEPSSLAPPRLCLHARRLGFVHPRSGEKVSFESPLPEEIVTFLDRLRARSSAPPSDDQAPDSPSPTESA
jgi:23S rRNA pseudouridine1911/1915/1917 synthase